MAVLDLVDELEEFCLALRPEETFRPNRLWQLPLTGLHDYTLPGTIAARLGPVEELARGGDAGRPVELVVCVTDVGDTRPRRATRLRANVLERTTPPNVMARAILASAAISALVLPLRVGDVIGTDGGWVHNFPLGHAYDNPAVRGDSGSDEFSAGGEDLAREPRLGFAAASSRFAPCHRCGR